MNKVDRHDAYLEDGELFTSDKISSSCFSRMHSTNHLSTILDSLGSVEGALLPGQTLTYNLRVPVDKDVGRRSEAAPW